MTPNDERIKRIAAKLSPDDAAELLEGWRYFVTDASDAEIEQLLNRYDPLPASDDATNEGKATQRMLRLAANVKTVDPEEADKLLQSWRYLQMHHSEADLDVMYPSPSREERRERGRQELERFFELGDGEVGH